MERLELVIVQFDEVRRLIEIGRVPQLRLAQVLIDGAVELIMHRMAQDELAREQINFSALENLRRLERAGRGNGRFRAEIERLQDQVTSNRRRKKINDNFGDRLDFLIERDRLPEDLGPVLKRLHEYRNETYHRDVHRTEVIRPAVLIYFDAACTVLDNYRPRGVVLTDSLGPEATRFMGDDPAAHNPFRLPHRAADQLRAEVGVDFETVRSALVDYLLGRLEDVEEGLAVLEANSTEPMLPGDSIRVVQIDEDDIDAILDLAVARTRNYPLTMNHLKSWTNRVQAMKAETDKHKLFAEFAAIEEEFESLEHRVMTAIMVMDEQANMR